MTKENAIKLFQDQRVRVHWNDEQEKWYFSIIDVIGVLTDSSNPRKYWSVLKTRLKQEGSEVATNCSRLKLVAGDGKMRLTDIADTEQLLRLIQSIPSPKAEPFKVWLAKVGYERIEETEDHEKAFDRAIETYLKKGYSEKWINQRLKSIEVRKELTDEWDLRGVKKGLEYAILTDEIKIIVDRKICLLKSACYNTILPIIYVTGDPQILFPLRNRCRLHRSADIQIMS
ncbi:MAG: Bro-N domain-containing protein [Melioribacteraceae bacterium]|nr:Bro-N domain-containing protein [Melioribacteraceae bacterium]